MDFHTVEPGALCTLGSGCEPFDHLCDVVLVHHPHLDPAFATAYGADKGGEFFRGQGLHHVGGTGRGQRRHPQRPARSHVPYGVLAGVLQLHGDLCAVPVHAFSQLGKARDKFIRRDTDLVRLGGTGREGDGAHAHDQQPGTAFGTCFVIGLDTFAAVPVGFGEVGAHGRHDDAITQLKGADAARRKQVGEFCHCYVSPW
ncbi:hypothetical protein D3C81_1387600 [compost metagenome]